MTFQANNPVISIITVVRNGAATIEACINSVTKYASPDIEHIIIDGGSTDGTVDSLRRHGDVITFWVSEPDHGIYDAMNKGLRQARGQWILFLGSDDELAVSPAQLIPRLQVPTTLYYGNAYWRHSRRTYDGPFSAAKLARANICQQAILYPRTALEKHPFNLRYRTQADWELNMRCFRDPEISFEYLPVTIAVYNDATGASTLMRDITLEADYIPLLWRHFPGPIAAWLTLLVIGGRLLRRFGWKS
ncbi:MAG: glycosyltransferase family 2 protein [bacterium]